MSSLGQKRQPDLLLAGAGRLCPRLEAPDMLGASRFSSNLSIITSRTVIQAWVLFFPAASVKVWKGTGSNRSSEALLDTSRAITRRLLCPHCDSVHLLRVFKGECWSELVYFNYCSQVNCTRIQRRVSRVEKARNTWSKVSDVGVNFHYNRIHTDKSGLAVFWLMRFL